MKITNEIVVHKAKAVGFDLVGFAKADFLDVEARHLEEWLNKGFQASMTYMGKNKEKRKNVKLILQNAKSVISLAVNYYIDEKYSNDKNKGKISRYAWSNDYHSIIWQMLGELEKELKLIEPNFESISYVDTGTVMDKVWAVKSGLGWIGKHTNVISKEFGSWIFLATIITNQEFDYSKTVSNFCGNCRACLDACPTGAIVQEYVVDANKCISFLTIENKNEIPNHFDGKFDNWLFGCDICQEVCPWNIKFSNQTSLKNFFPLNGFKELELKEVLQLNEDSFNIKFRQLPIKRAKLKGLKRNAKFLLRNFYK
jgi:epoxyqueuosine reductase